MSPQNINTKLVMFSILVLTKFEFFTIVYYTCNFMYIPPTSAQRRQSTELYSVLRFSPQIVFHLPLLPSHFTSRMRLVGTRHLVSVSEELLRSWLLPLIQYLSTQPIYLEILRQQCCPIWWGQSTFMIVGSWDKLSLWVLVVNRYPRLHKTQSAGAGFKLENKKPHHKTQTRRSDQLAKSKKVFTSLSNETRTFIETDTETYFETNILRPRLLFLDQNFRDRY